MVFLRQEYLFQGDEDVKQINKNGAPQWFVLNGENPTL